METTIGQRIAMLRNHLRFTQQDFADLVNITVGQLSRLENGKNIPQKRTLEVIINKTSVNIDWLINGTGELILAAKMDVSLNWKDEAYHQANARIDQLTKELERAWSVVKLLSKDSGVNLNFLKPLIEAMQPTLPISA